MKKITISIITVCLNNEKTIAYTLYSVYRQTYKNIEHIFVDGGSTDDTVAIIKKHKRRGKKIIIAQNSKIYDAINIGINNCAGDYVLVLNSDDILSDKYVIEKAVNIIIKKKLSFYLGDIIYFNNTEFNKPIRFYSAQKFKISDFRWGLMPPHPGCFVKRSIAKKYLYNVNFSIAADYDFFLRAIKINHESYEKINLIITRMRTGGISGKNLMSHIISSFEIYKSRKINGEFANHLMILWRFISKLKQFLMLNKSYEKFSLNHYYEKLNRYHFQIITNILRMSFKNNFTLSALNLAFLGCYSNKEIKIYKNLIHWPDGRFSKNIHPSLEKIPGREVINNLKIPKNIKKITVFGDLPDKSKKFLEQKFQKKIFVKTLPFGTIKKIIKNLSYKIIKNELILITLPTPKQEQLAEYLISKNKFYKIICIGGSINICSGVETEVPRILYNYEFLWRLRYETFRRLKRLIHSLFHFVAGKYYNKNLNNLTAKLIS
jgi:glycosyltransferase involved in cell wall biosynthesis